MTDDKLREAAVMALNALTGATYDLSTITGQKLGNAEDALRAVLASSTNPDTNQYLLVEPTEEMVEAFLSADYKARTEYRRRVGGGRGSPYRSESQRVGVVAGLRAALAAAQPEKQEG